MAKERDLTQGNILAALVRFALPVLLALFLQSLYGGVDLLVVGQFAETADVSGVATGSTLMQTATMIIAGLSMGLTVLVARRIGERSAEEAGRAVGAGICLFAVIAVVLSICLAAFAEKFALLLHAPVEAMGQTADYIRICGVGAVFIVAYNLLGAIFRGIGDSKTPLMTVCIACVLNIVGDLFFVAVLRMGAAGAAIATVLSQGISVAVSLWVISHKKLPFRMTRQMLRFDRALISCELRLGTPIALQEFLVGISFLVVQAIVNSIDLIASAGVGVAEKVCGFIMLVPSTYMQAMAAFVAQNMGAGKPERAKRALLCGIATALGVGVVIAAFAFVRGDILANIFSKDGAVIAAAHSYLKAYAIDVLLTSVMFCMVGYYNGCGKTFFVMLQGIIGAVGVRIPVVYLISRIPNASLFMIGLATPSATVVQIILCVGYMAYLKRRPQTELRI